MRKLINGLVLLLCLTFAPKFVFSQDYKSNDILPKGVPKRFEDYRKNGTRLQRRYIIIKLDGEWKPFVADEYDTNHDDIRDVSELYPDDSDEPSENPLFYLFDINDNRRGIFDPDGWYIDETMDGPNGNEVRFDRWMRYKERFYRNDTL